MDVTLGEIVYLKVAQERAPGMVTGILQRPGVVVYMVTWEDGSETEHFEIELTKEFVPNWEEA